MRGLLEEHVDEISKNPRVDVERVRKIKYLFEFDRSFKAQHGVTPLKEHTTVMHPLVIPSSPSEYLSWL